MTMMEDSADIRVCDGASSPQPLPEGFSITHLQADHKPGVGTLHEELELRGESHNEYTRQTLF